MTEEANAAEKALDDAAQIAAGADQETPETEQTDTPNPAEEKARADGWVSKEEWVAQGKPEGAWRDAAEFNDRGDRIANLERQLEEKDRASQERFRRMEEMNSRALERQRQKAIEEYDAQIKAAATEGDVETVEKAVAERDKLQSEPQQAAPQQPRFTPEDQQLIANFAAQNRWFQRDQEATELAARTSNRLAAEGKTVAEQLEGAAQAVAAAYGYAAPQTTKTETAKIPEAPAAAVDGGSANHGRGLINKGGSKVSRLPAEAKSQGQRFVKQGLYKSLDEYAEEYFA
ncbi:MAG: hypothetical protein AAFU68_02745 [Pseudomonadota bacterium]